MQAWKDLAHFLYGRGFWYADPLREIDGLTEEQLYWVPDPNALCILWQVGHIAHRERLHVGHFLQGIGGPIVPERYAVFGTDWCTSEEIRGSIDSVDGVLAWVRDVRGQSHEYVASLGAEDFHVVPQTSHNELSVAHWLFITASHTALHIGRIQLLRALVKGVRENPC